MAVQTTIILATLAWAAGEVLMRRSPRADQWARAAWTAGIGLTLLHVALAFHVVYGWHHELAVAETARQAEERVGLAWRGSIYVNYVFLAIWLADTCWWWTSPASHASRSRRLELARLAMFVFMFVNAAIVFASGVGRVAGVCAVAAVLCSRPIARVQTRPA
jgi:hypothetical protein